MDCGSPRGAPLHSAHNDGFVIQVQLHDFHALHPIRLSEVINGRLQELNQPALQAPPVHFPDFVNHHVHPFHRLLLTLIGPHLRHGGSAALCRGSPKVTLFQTPHPRQNPRKQERKNGSNQCKQKIPKWTSSWQDARHSLRLRHSTSLSPPPPVISYTQIHSSAQIDYSTAQIWRK